MALTLFIEIFVGGVVHILELVNHLEVLHELTLEPERAAYQSPSQTHVNCTVESLSRQPACVSRPS